MTKLVLIELSDEIVSYGKFCYVASLINRLMLDGCFCAQQEIFYG